jgi:hypothetical protein
LSIAIRSIIKYVLFVSLEIPAQDRLMLTFISDHVMTRQGDTTKRVILSMLEEAHSIKNYRLERSFLSAK